MTDAGRAPVARRWLAGGLALAVLGGCASVPSTNVNTDRLDYGQVVAESWKRQTLLNVVRLRYADAPVFLDVSSIINSYTLGGNVTAKGTFPSSVNPNVGEIGGTANWSNTPTVTYQPLLGDRFTKSLLQPIPPVAIFQLLQGGWAANLVLRTVVGSINGLTNDFLGAAAEPEFIELSETLTRIQRAGNIGIRVEPRTGGSAAILVMRGGSAGLTPDSLRLRKLLGLSSDATEFDVNYGLVSTRPNEVAVLSRSMMEIMLQLGYGVDVPAEHAARGRAMPSQVGPGDTPVKALVHIQSGKEAPADAYAAVSYKGYSYWIADDDIVSKRTFTFLMILFSLAETGQNVAAPIVTVPSR